MCGGEPEWRYFNTLEGEGIPDDYKKKLGFLSLSGKEKMYALDGQHRMLGIKRALEREPERLQQDTVTVIFVHHDEHSPSGLRKSRRLFTVLNKHAVKVTKRDIIYLDEDDTMAVVTRMLVEEKGGIFERRKRVASTPDNQFRGQSTPCYTTIGILYDCLNDLFPVLIRKYTKKRAKELREKCLEEGMLSMLKAETESIFNLIIANTKELNAYYRQKEGLEKIVDRYRSGEENDHLLFRPMGLHVYIKVLIRCYQEYGDWNIAVKRCSKLPMRFGDPLLWRLIWNDKKKTIVGKNFTVLRRLYLHMLGLSKEEKSKLLEDYKKAIDDNSVKLPDNLNG